MTDATGFDNWNASQLAAVDAVAFLGRPLPAPFFDQF
jgi:hypothetical protein